MDPQCQASFWAVFDVYYTSGVVFYILVAIIFNYIYNNYNVIKVNIIWSCITVILAVILGSLFENEDLTYNKIIALFFAILAIYFSQ
jgi:multidrug transporter EmrE-like cation transporter